MNGEIQRLHYASSCNINNRKIDSKYHEITRIIIQNGTK
jgi:hypothetical protein